MSIPSAVSSVHCKTYNLLKVCKESEIMGLYLGCVSKRLN